MLVEEMFVMALIGAITGAIISLIVEEGKYPIHILFLALLGATTGWIGGIIWVYLTGGLSLTLTSLVIPVILTAFASMIALSILKDKNLLPKPSHDVKPIAIVASIAVIIILAFSATLPYLPIEGQQTQPTTSLPTSISTTPQTLQPLTISDMSSLQPQTTMANLLDISITKSAVEFPSIAENPQPGQYLKFEVSFTVSTSDWPKPKIKILVVKDEDNNGAISTGDKLWPSDLYKYPLDADSWRIHVAHHSDGTAQAIYWDTATGEALWAYHATLTQPPSFNEEGQTLTNTPEGFVCPNDMISISQNGLLLDGIGNYISIPKGSTVTITGKIYAPDNESYIGQHIISVVAADDYYGPLATKTLTFTIQMPPPPDINILIVTVTIGLVGMLGVAAIYVPKYL